MTSEWSPAFSSTYENRRCKNCKATRVINRIKNVIAQIDVMTCRTCNYYSKDGGKTWHKPTPIEMPTGEEK